MGERPGQRVRSVAAFRYLTSGPIPLLRRLLPFLELDLGFACAGVLTGAIEVRETDVLVVGVHHDAFILFDGVLISYSI